MTLIDPPELLGLVQGLRQDPDDDTTRLVLADYLDEQPPTPITGLGLVPNWLRLSWLALVPKELRGTSRTSEAVYDHISNYLTYHGWHDYGLDNGGTTTLAGLTCFVSETDVDERGDDDAEDVALNVFRPLHTVLPCCAYAFCRHGQGRAILFPPLTMPKRRRGPVDPARLMALLAANNVDIEDGLPAHNGLFTVNQLANRSDFIRLINERAVLFEGQVIDLDDPDHTMLLIDQLRAH
jgi:hypothetical protein